MLVSSTQIVRPFVATFSIVHYVGVDADWHAQLQLARLDDPGFSSPLIDVDSSASQSGWRYRDEHADVSDGSLQSWPVGGVSGRVSQAVERQLDRDGNPDVPVIATAFYRVDADGDLASFAKDERLLARAAQSSDGGTSWSDWMTWEVR